MGWRWLLLVSCVLACGPVVDPDAMASSTTMELGETSSTSDDPVLTTAVDATTDKPMPLDLAAPDENLSGSYLFAVAAIIDPGHPLQWIANVSHTSGPGGDALKIELQSLSLDVGSTNAPREPVGDTTVLEVGLDDNGRFGVEAPLIIVPGAANPITGGDISTSLVIEGTVFGRSLWCGDVFGQVTMPLMLDLSGSTFAAEPIDGALPDPVLAACPP